MGEKSLNGSNEPIAVLSKLGYDHDDASEFFHHLEKLEGLLASQGLKGYQIIDPTYHLRNTLVDRGVYHEETPQKEIRQRHGGLQQPPRSRDSSTLFRSFVPTTPAPDPTEVLDYIKSGRTWGMVKYGVFQMTLRRVEMNMVLPARPGKTVTLTQVDSDNPGSGTYEAALHEMEKMAKKAGFVVFIVEGVDNPKHWKFYEQRMGYKRHPRDSEIQHSYYIEL